MKKKVEANIEGIRDAIWALKGEVGPNYQKLINERRGKTIYISAEDIFNLFPDRNTSEFSLPYFQIPEGIFIRSVTYDHEIESFLFVIYHELFEAIEAGLKLPCLNHQAGMIGKKLFRPVNTAQAECIAKNIMKFLYENCWEFEFYNEEKGLCDDLDVIERFKKIIIDEIK